MLDCALNLKTLQHFLPQMLVPNQRFESMPFFRLPNGTPIECTKEFNNRVYLNSTIEFSLPQFDLINIEDLDVVLISNFNSMLALPYLCKLKGFRANIYVKKFF
jgi:integrator complex subunit 9